MIIVDERNCLKNELSTLASEPLELFHNLQVMNFKSFTSLSLTKMNEIALIDIQTILKYPDLMDDFRVVMNIFTGVIFFYDGENQKEIEWIKKESVTSSKILGIYTYSLDQMNSLVLINQVKFVWQLLEEQKSLQKQLVHFSFELEEVLQTAQSEMTKAKKIYETFIPKRTQEIKGIVFSNKYLAGDGGGAEFFDLIQTSNKIYQILISSQSYLLTSSVMGILSRYKDEGFNPETFIYDVSEDAKKINSSKKQKFVHDLLVLEIDPISLKLILHTDSEVVFFSQGIGKIKLNKDAPYQLQKGEKIVALSGGFTFNWMNKKVKKDLDSVFKADNVNSIQDLMSELFFQLKEDVSGELPRKDSTLLIMEVNRHGIHKI